MKSYSDSKLSTFLDEKTYSSLQKQCGPDWFETLPELVEDLKNEFSCETIKLLPGGRTAAVLLFYTPHGKKVIKIAPDINRSKAEHAALNIIEKQGIGPKIYKYEQYEKNGVSSSILVTEFLGDGNSLRTSTDKQKITSEAISNLLLKIANCGEQELGIKLTSIESMLLENFQNQNNPGSFGKLEMSNYEIEEVKNLLEDFSNNSSDKTWIHGTLHPGNLIEFRGEIMVVDPRPLYGDKIYDVAEICLKWGSEKNERRHNLEDGISQLKEVQRYISIDIEKAIAWMKVLLVTRF